MKTKVIAFRVTQQEYDALAFMASASNKKIAEYVNNCMRGPKWEAVEALRKEQKRLEAKAKRDAKKEASSGL